MHLLASQTCSRDLDQLGDEIAELSAHLDAAPAPLLDLIREFDARVVHVDAPVLADPDHPGQSLLENGARVSAETSRCIACDASLVVMRHDRDGRVVEVGARTRTIPPAIRRSTIATAAAALPAARFASSNLNPADTQPTKTLSS